MNQFCGKICPYCKTAFTDDDDIVVCSQCGMPHHKECWIENQGCAVFGCNGTIQSADSFQASDSHINIVNPETDFDIELYPSDSDLRTAYCPSCGSSHEPADLFCKHCGYNFSMQAKDKEDAPCCSGFSPYVNSSFTSSQYSGTNAIDEDKYIVGNIDFYKMKFSKMRSLNKKTSWNWAAFLFAPYWCIYRKMYGIGVAVLGGTFIFSQLEILGSIAVIVGYLVFGLFANYLYMQRIQQFIHTEHSLQDPYKAQHIKKYSGTNTIATVLTIIGYAFVIMLVNS